MLGAVKDDAEAQAPLFRGLRRRWKSLGSAKRERAAPVSMAPGDEQPKAARAWISKPRQIYAHQKVEPKSRSWNPWLWVK
jgi:hypothetical protein